MSRGIDEIKLKVNLKRFEHDILRKFCFDNRIPMSTYIRDLLVQANVIPEREREIKERKVEIDEVVETEEVIE
jgi:hypothetical protein